MRMSHPCERIAPGNRVGKRSFRRAKLRALREGRALYKGKWYTAAQFQYTQDFPRTDTSKRQKPLKCIRRPGERSRAGRLKFFSWNCGGLSLGQFDELVSWCTEKQFDVVFVQETRWKNEFTWISGSFHGNSWCGLLVLISKRITTPSLVRWISIIPGRVMHVRVADQTGTLDLINCYQQPLSMNAERKRVREQVWTPTCASTPSSPATQQIALGRRL